MADRPAACPACRRRLAADALWCSACLYEVAPIPPPKPAAPSPAPVGAQGRAAAYWGRQPFGRPNGGTGRPAARVPVVGTVFTLVVCGLAVYALAAFVLSIPGVR